jgi:hypothetical protein
MWRSKKLIVGVVLAAVLLFGSLGGVVLAADNGDDSQPGALFGALWDKVCAIYEEKTGDTLDQEALKDSFVQARSEMRAEALQNRLQSLVNEGQITQEQADEYLEWQQSRPDVPVQFGFRGHGGFRGMGGMRGFGAPCVPTG